jgi:hypothetical protein
LVSFLQKLFIIGVGAGVGSPTGLQGQRADHNRRPDKPGPTHVRVLLIPTISDQLSGDDNHQDWLAGLYLRSMASGLLADR